MLEQLSGVGHFLQFHSDGQEMQGLELSCQDPEKKYY